MLFAAGLESGASPELWNVDHPDRVRAIHRGYIEAGSRIILTNSFGGTSYRLKLHQAEKRVAELNRAAAALARTEADAAVQPVLVAGSIGPSGDLLDPLGEMTFDEAKAAFAEQAAGLVAGGVDLLWVETMSDLGEVRAAVEGARSVADLPVVATMSFDTRGHTMMGVSPAQAVAELSELQLAAIGANCGNGFTEVEEVIEKMHAVNSELLLVAKANAGIPRWEKGQLIYDGTPDRMAEYARRVHGLGASLIGACCGSTPQHLAAMAAALNG
jgi:5-methyltetrahydrofolate--homocysteine methyltransferase